eukprot:jgi/Mesen1/1520/ME000132S00455
MGTLGSVKGDLHGGAALDGERQASGRGEELPVSSKAAEPAHTAIRIDDDDEPAASGRKDVIFPIVLKFESIRYKVRIQHEGTWWNPAGLMRPREEKEKEILHGVSGNVQPGEVLALMGPSGGGKTTLLNVLGGRARAHVDGAVTYSGLPYNKGLKRRVGFVTQDDLFFAHLTVRETLVYAALLRLPRHLSRAQKVQRADDTIEELGLGKCKNTIIGGQFLRGISGGERKRVSIGHEILIDPSLLLLDEPTSGLDSTTALRIIMLLHRIAASGRTVVTTIHQPSSRLFHSFDKLLLLCEGHSIFFGKASEGMPYFARIGFSPFMSVNPADFMLDLASGTVQGISVPAPLEQQDNPKWSAKSGLEQQADVKKYLVESFQLEQQQQQQQQPPQQQSSKGLHQVAALGDVSNDGDSVAVLHASGWNATWWQQFSVLWTRGIKERRHEFLSPLRILQIVATSFIVGCLWFDSKLHTQQDVQDQVGLLFFMVLFWGFFPLMSAIFTFPQERAMLAKERASNMYRLSAYFMSRTLSDIPLEYCLPVLFMVVVYWMANLKATADAFIFCTLTVFINIAAAQGLGFLLGAAIMDVKKATTFASIIILTFMLAGGYYLQNVPGFISWVKYLSFNYYTYKLVMLTQYDSSQTYACGAPPNPYSQRCRIGDSPSLSLVDLDSSGWQNVWPMLIMVVGYRVLAYWSLRRMKTQV